MTALLPDTAVTHCRISRGDVFDVAAQVLDGARPATHLFAASFVWATGLTGYGPALIRRGTTWSPRYMRHSPPARRIRSRGTPSCTAATIRRGRRRTSPPWARVHSYGPAFFTKLLYFAAPGALILDRVLAATVHRLAGIRHLVTARRRPVAWSPYRYAVYLHWMRLTAARLGVRADVLEYTLFQTRAVTAP